MAAVTALSSLGGQVCMDSRANELWISRISGGTLKAGWLISCVDGINAVGKNPAGNLDEFIGIALPRYDIDVDTAITTSLLMDIVIPQGGHLYNVKITNPGATAYAGEPLKHHATVAGELQIAGDVEATHVARLFDDVLDTTTFATIIWGV